MADPMDLANHAQLVAGGAAGGAARVYLRNPGTIPKMVAMGAVCIGLSSAFGEPAHHYLVGFGFNLPASGATVGLLGLTVAEGLLKAFSRFDFSTLLKGKQS